MGIIHMVQEGKAKAFGYFVLQLALFGSHLFDVECVSVVIVFQGREVEVDVLLSPWVGRVVLDGKFGEASCLLV